MAGRWVDVAEAAHELGISTDAVRKRIARGSLESDRPNGSVLVWLNEGGTEAGREAQGEGDGALVEVLTDQVSYLREQLAEEREARRRADTIIAQLTQATSNLTDRLRELEAPAPSEPTDAAETVEEEPEEATPRPATPGPQRPVERRPWWRRIVGG
jgi:predicted ArsR family transcriptional regulator